MTGHDRRPASTLWGAYGGRNLSEDGLCCRLLTERVIGLPGIEPGERTFWLVVGGAPSRIRTCAHGSGGRCSLP